MVPLSHLMSVIFNLVVVLMWIFLKDTTLIVPPGVLSLSQAHTVSLIGKKLSEIYLI